MDRKRHSYRVMVAPLGGESNPVEQIVECYWSPEYEGIFELVKNAAAAEASYRTKAKIVALSAELV